MLLFLSGLYEIYQPFDIEQYYEKSFENHQKITAMGFFSSKVAVVT